MENYSPIVKNQKFEELAHEGKGHWYGTVYQTDNKKKPISFTVNKLMDSDKQYKFRICGKCQAGFHTIYESTTTPKGLSHYINKTTICVQFQNEHGNWLTAMSFKGGKFYSVDLAILEGLQVGHMHNHFPKMVDWNLWKMMNTKSHASFVYKFNTKN